MRYGISAAALIVQNDRVLLVNHRETGKYDFWVPPGGSLSGSESILDCARRETLEETGLTVELGQILYIQEFWQPGYHFCKFFILCTAFSGNLTLANREPGETFLVDVRFFPQEALQDLTVFPTVLKDSFWQEIRIKHPVTRYLGLERLLY
jgi:8-oxo-dGTP diphosphatase